MAAQLSHPIVSSSDRRASARFLADILGRRDPVQFGRFDAVKFDNGASLDFVRDGDRASASIADE